MRKGEATRERLMDIAEAAILTKGFAGTSIDEIIAEAEITKSGFFYHFSDKGSLARALMERYIATEEMFFDDLFAAAEGLHDDPLHVFLIALKLFADKMADMKTGHPGCLVATYCYTEQLFDSEVRDLYRSASLNWRMRFRGMLETIADRYPPRDAVDLDHLADMINNCVEGGIVMSRAMGEPKILSEQILLFRSYIKLLFLPPVQ